MVVWLRDAFPDSSVAYDHSRSAIIFVGGVRSAGQNVLGEVRGVFGVHLAILAAKFGLSVEGELAGIVPGERECGRGE